MDWNNKLSFTSLLSIVSCIAIKTLSCTKVSSCQKKLLQFTYSSIFSHQDISDTRGPHDLTSYNRDPEFDAKEKHPKTYQNMDLDYILANSGCIKHSGASGNVPHREHPATLSQTVSFPFHNISSLFRNCFSTLFPRKWPRKRQPPPSRQSPI